MKTKRLTTLFSILLLAWILLLLQFARQSSTVFGQPTIDWWTAFGHDSAHTGFSQSKAPANNVTLWIYDTHHQVMSSPVVCDGVLLIGNGASDDKNVYGLNATTGLLLWNYELVGGSSPCAENGKAIFGSYSGLHALDIVTGKSVWNTSTYSDELKSPIVANGRVFAVGGKAIFAFDENDGDEIWHFTSSGSFSSPAVSNNVVFVGSVYNGVYALDAASGQQKWNYPTSEQTYVSSVAGNKVLVISERPSASNPQDANKLLAFDASSGAYLWRFDANPHGRTDAKFVSSAFHDGKVFVTSSMSIDNYGAIFALEANTGTHLWNSSVGNYHTAPAIADGRIYLMSYDGQMQALSESNGNLIWSYATGGSASSTSPAVANGRVYTGAGNGKVYCFGSMVYYSVNIDPTFYDNNGKQITPSSWILSFPNGTEKTVTDSETFSAPMGIYSINRVFFRDRALAIRPSVSFFLDSDTTWRPQVNCVVPTYLSIFLSGSTSYVGLKATIEGSLTCNEVGVPKAPIRVSYSVTQGSSWSDITLVETDTQGDYSAIWMLPATGNYLIKALWQGNNTFPQSTSTVSLAVIPNEEQSVFSVSSNSTISALSFNSESRELNFTVTGSSDTLGYADVYIAKTLLPNVNDVRAYLDGNTIEYTSSSLEESYSLHFTYLHSSHIIVLMLGVSDFPLGIPVSIETLALIGIIVAIICGGVGYLFLRKSKNKNRSYEVSKEDGTITFGDGENGARPHSGCHNDLFLKRTQGNPSSPCFLQNHQF